MSQKTESKGPIYFFPLLKKGREIPVDVAAFGVDGTFNLTVMPFITNGRLGFRCQGSEDEVYLVHSDESSDILSLFQAAEMASCGAVTIRCGSSDDMNSASDLLAAIKGTAGSGQLERTMDDFGIDDEYELHRLLESSRDFFPSSMDAINIMGKLPDKQAEEFAESLRQAADDGRYRDYGKYLMKYTSERFQEAASRRFPLKDLLDLIRS